MQHKNSFAPVIGPDTRLLVLGSLPGETSLAQARYYAHPRNQFWTLMGAVVGKDLAGMGYQDRLRNLLDAGVGLWDVVASASRLGSLDANIRDHIPNELSRLVESLPRLRVVGFNGATAATIGRKQLGRLRTLALIDLPSSSPAYTLALPRKREQWLRLARWVDPAGSGSNP